MPFLQSDLRGLGSAITHDNLTNRASQLNQMTASSVQVIWLVKSCLMHINLQFRAAGKPLFRGQNCTTVEMKHVDGLRGVFYMN